MEVTLFSFLKHKNFFYEMGQDVRLQYMTSNSVYVYVTYGWILKFVYKSCLYLNIKELKGKFDKHRIQFSFWTFHIMKLSTRPSFTARKYLSKFMSEHVLKEMKFIFIIVTFFAFLMHTNQFIQFNNFQTFHEVHVHEKKSEK